MADAFTWIFGLFVFALVLGPLAWKAFRHGGLKAAMFGAKIDRTLGEVAAGRHGPVSSRLKVHSLTSSNGDRLVGLELVAKSFASFSMVPVTLTLHDARQLTAMLQAAVSEPISDLDRR